MSLAMETYQNLYRDNHWRAPLPANTDAQLVLLFGDRELALSADINAALAASFPNAQIVGCSTSGEILGTELHDQSLCLTAVRFNHTPVKAARADIRNRPLQAAVDELANALGAPDLKYLLVLSDDQRVNGTELVNGLTAALPKGVVITGGLAGDDTRFERTATWHNGRGGEGNIVACGFYGNCIEVGHGSMGGWDPFGPERLITRARSNVLYSLDDQPALALYKRYLGEHASALPASALLFPLLIKREGEEQAVIRTILGVNEQDESMTFAGDMPQGAKAQLMRANFDRLIDGAETAASAALSGQADANGCGLALLISCVGRRLVLNQRIEEELEAVEDVLGNGWQFTGFYSYGEISPMAGGNHCALHNQTMTITTLQERDA
ncbi:FIST C-terminal domain-containing protein [Simiduia sp. 21SJ11W-1]|uniref:FIST signal transduction protein n=1 Tax=Simiduia sp. 21SJ11W-1 TaxID=2909669 RepID=UPI0020A054ED|nr:FIST N-terminal domain-containing protein [Simiduia sp. 21SJ11W-1]UTA47174.1 FIST C-terminal domain-containing protein [Simiduia sp. 21SJ11W-1]